MKVFLYRMAGARYGAVGECHEGAGATAADADPLGALLFVHRKSSFHYFGGEYKPQLLHRTLQSVSQYRDNNSKFLCNTPFFLIVTSPLFGASTRRRVITFLYVARLSHSIRYATLGRTVLDEWWARRRDLYLTTHSTRDRHHGPGGIRTRNSSKRASCNTSNLNRTEMDRPCCGWKLRIRLHCIIRLNMASYYISPWWAENFWNIRV